ncbi:MAG: response regulator transcription factor [Limisphaerales bacterium]
MKTEQANRQVRTLIADDSPFALKALAQILELEGRFTLVGTATDGCQAIRRAFFLKPELVLMDYLMPHVNGIEATRQIKQFENPPLVIIVTSDDPSRCRPLATAAGADGFVDKSADLHAQLHLVLQELFKLPPETSASP